MSLLSRLFLRYRKVFSFFVCLILSLFAWMALHSQKGSTVLKFRVKYSENLDIAQRDSIIIQTNSSFFSPYLAYKDNKRNLLKVKELSSKHPDYIVSRELIAENRVNIPEKSIVSIYPDTIFIKKRRYRKYYTKKRVPIVLKLKVNSTSPYILETPIQYSPKNITLYGNKNDLVNITQVETKVVVKKNIYSDMDIAVPIDMTTLTKVKPSVDHIKAKIRVSIFTEKKIICPIKILHQPYNAVVKIIPQQATIILKTNIKDYDRPNAYGIQAEVDANERLTKGNRMLTIKIRNIPSYCKLVDIYPKFVDYIVYPK